jgi:predicted ATPase
MRARHRHPLLSTLEGRCRFWCRFASSLGHCERAIAVYDPEQHDGLVRVLGTDQGIGARSLALRAATSLTPPWRDRGNHAEARDLLAPLYAWFTESFDTRDLVEAKALLDELG